MNTKELILPDDWEVKKVVGNKIILGEKVKELPKTWEDCCKVLEEGEFINSASEIKQVSFNNISEFDKNLLPDGLGKSMLSLCQLLICRNAWWKQLGWKPEWGDKKPFKWCIHNENGFIIVTSHSKFSRILAFPTNDIASQFQTTFRDLIEEAKELL